jgi:hypothetical protein
MSATSHRGYDTAAKRWAGVGPYYAMFPVSFADTVIAEHTRPGDWVFDPFAGRGTAMFSAASLGRYGLGAEINPVGWVYSQAKLQTADKADVEQRILEIARLSSRYRKPAATLSPFFKLCYSVEVRAFLLAARDYLNWRRSPIDWTTMAFILVDLHGKRGYALSNQMRQTKSMSPQYAVAWWRERKMWPPDIDPVEFLLKRVAWRYAKGKPETVGSKVYLGDCRNLMARYDQMRKGRRMKQMQLLLTSPPYFGVTNYFYDQWMRLWMLGGSFEPKTLGESLKGRFGNKEAYCNLLGSTFARASKMLAPEAVVFVRTDAREFTLNATAEALKEAFPHKRLRVSTHSSAVYTQTALFDSKVKSVGEVDLVLW